MKKTKLILCITSGILTIIGFLSMKAEKKASVTSVKFKQLFGSSCINVSATNFTTIKGTIGKTIFLETVGGTRLASLYTCTSVVRRVYYH
jgi:uncharacterized FlgJ-related protein